MTARRRGRFRPRLTWQRSGAGLRVPPTWCAGSWCWCARHTRPPRVSFGAVPRSSSSLGHHRVDVLVRYQDDRMGAARAVAQRIRRRNHRLRSSGTVLYPFGFVLLLIAAAMAPSLTTMTQGVCGACRALRLSFVAISLPSLFATVVKRLIGRARPYVGGHDGPFMYLPFSGSLNMPACRPATRRRQRRQPSRSVRSGRACVQ